MLVFVRSGLNIPHIKAKIYTLIVDDGQGTGELSFGEKRAIVDCRHYERDSLQSYGTMSVAVFIRRFGVVVESLVPEEIYKQYLMALKWGLKEFS